VLAQFEERGQRRKVVEDGVFIDKAETKFWVKWDGESSAKTTVCLNITRMFEDLLKSKNCPGALPWNRGEWGFPPDPDLIRARTQMRSSSSWHKT
jgi:hypothetical protein